MDLSLTERLASLPKLANIPRKELEWLAENGDYVTYEVGTVVGPKGKRVHYLWIVLCGAVAIRVDRGVGPRLVTEWRSGDVTGMLPYSRMVGPPGDNYIEERADLIAIHVDLFPQMINACPSFTAYTVHSMIDRARNFNTSDLQDEKMISLGKLSAGLAHELNNPASASVRDAKLLLKSLSTMDTASRALGAADLTDLQLEQIIALRHECFAASDRPSLSPIQKADYQDTIADWLVSRGLDTVLAPSLADTCVSLEQLEKLAATIQPPALDATLNWMVASCTTQLLAMEIEQVATQIYKVVDAVKKFTFMGSMAEKEFVNVESGIRNTIDILVAKINAKQAVISVEINKTLPQVFANGSDLNQVWFSLLDNALDAISASGNINIKAHTEMDRIVVCVTDDGPGISSDILAKIFDPFFTTKAPGQGTGLGLDITRRLLRRYHGDITVQSRPGRTEFRVSLLQARHIKMAKSG